jgi:hypothetical protein
MSMVSERARESTSMPTVTDTKATLRTIISTELAN